MPTFEENLEELRDRNNEVIEMTDKTAKRLQEVIESGAVEKMSDEEYETFQTGLQAFTEGLANINSELKQFIAEVKEQIEEHHNKDDTD